MHYVENVPFLLSGGADESIRCALCVLFVICSLFNLTEAKEQGTILFHHGDVNTIEFAGQEMMLSGGSDGKVVLWRTKDWSRVKTLGSHR